MLDEKTTVLQSNAHKYFWVYVLVFLVILVVMITFSSMSQEKIKIEKQQISEQLNEEKNYSKGIQETVQDISEENDALKQENQSLKAEIAALQKEVKKLQQENQAYLDNQERLQNLKEAYVAGNLEECSKIIAEIEENLIPEEELDQYSIIKKDLEGKQ